MKKIHALILMVLTVLATFTISVATPVYAQTPKQSVCEGIGLVDGSGNCTDPAGQPSITTTLKNVMNVIGVVVGVIAVIMVIISGLKYITSGGDSQKISSAKDTLLYAIIGLVIVALSQVIVKFVLGKATS